ncbi:hypothetical protein [Bradyrhizobium sp.]
MTLGRSELRLYGGPVSRPIVRVFQPYHPLRHISVTVNYMIAVGTFAK